MDQPEGGNSLSGWQGKSAGVDGQTPCRCTGRRCSCRERHPNFKLKNCCCLEKKCRISFRACLACVFSDSHKQGLAITQVDTSTRISRLVFRQLYSEAEYRNG